MLQSFNLSKIFSLLTLEFLHVKILKIHVYIIDLDRLSTSVLLWLIYFLLRLLHILHYLHLWLIQHLFIFFSLSFTAILLFVWLCPNLLELHVLLRCGLWPLWHTTFQFVITLWILNLLKRLLALLLHKTLFWTLYLFILFSPTSSKYIKRTHHIAATLLLFTFSCLGSLWSFYLFLLVRLIVLLLLVASLKN